MTWNWESAWPAPAKLNLFLHVTGRRADGYHLLQTVFRFIDFADTLRFEPRADGRIVLATPTAGVPDEQNLVVRAAEALQKHSREARRKSPLPRGRGWGMEGQKLGAGGTARDGGFGATIHLEKRIPMGGGLGGGSSDAATTLVALDHLWGSGLTRVQLQAIGLTLGADVPIFIHGRNCFAAGIGDEFHAVDVPPARYLLTLPALAVPTAEIFRSPLLKRDTAALAPADWHPGFGHNDLEPVACALYPEIARHLRILRRHGDARMTGSGAGCFVACDSEAAAESARRALPADMRAYVACGLPAHPLLSLAH